MNLRLTCIGFGTRGDITPLVTLAARLCNAGHHVRFATHPEFAGLLARHQLEHVPVPGSYQDFLATAEGRRALGIPRNSPLGCLALFTPFEKHTDEAFSQAWAASDAADGLICNALALAPAGMIAGRRGTPVVAALVVPILPTRQAPHPAMPPWPLGGAYNRLTYTLAQSLIHYGSSRVFRQWEAAATRLGGQVRHASVPVTTVIPVSPALVPWSDEWSSSTHVTGFWFPPSSSDTGPSADLQRFVDGGPPPLVFGFGSMADNEPDQLRAIVRDTVQQIGRRAVIVGGSGAAITAWSDDERVRHVDFIDYAWLFPRAAAIVHQGGVGTASYALRAGVPQVTVPYCLDHAFWASRLHQVGVAPRGLPRHRLSTPALTSSVREVLSNPSYQSRAAALATSIRADRGLDVAEQLVLRHFSSAAHDHF